jgi:hypothetical protein
MDEAFLRKKHSVLITGKIGTSVIYKYYRKAKKAVCMAYYSPTQPNTPAQLAARARFAQAARSWAALATSDKNTWEQRARQYGIYGRNLYIRHFLAQQLSLNTTYYGTTYYGIGTYGTSTGALYYGLSFFGSGNNPRPDNSLYYGGREFAERGFNNMFGLKVFGSRQNLAFNVRAQFGSTRFGDRVYVV